MAGPLPAGDVEAILEAAVAEHRAGRLAEAEAAYGKVLAAAPGNPRALHNLGFLLLRRKEQDRALPLLAAAYAAAPPGFPAWAGYVEGLIAVERFQTAADVLERSGSGPQARMLELRLRQAWGMALMRDDAHAEAEAQFRRAAELAPDDADVHLDLGLALMRQDHPSAAAAILARALELAPEHVAARINYGSALRATGRLEEAEAAYRRALELEPGHPAAIRNLAGLLNDQGRFDEVLAGTEGAWTSPGAAAEVLLTRGNALSGAGRFAEALDCYRAVADTPELRYEALTRIALVEASQRRHDDALKTLDTAIALKPDEPLARFRRSFVRLIRCDFEGGWPDYEQRLKLDEFLTHTGVLATDIRAAITANARPQDLAGKRVLLVAEQGIGDQVMFASCIPDLVRDAGPITCACDGRLVGLFGNSFPGLSWLPLPGASAYLSDYDVVLALGSLGLMYRRRMEDFPRTPYLRPRDEAVARWAERLGPKPEGLRIGLSWRGGSHRTGMARRSLTLDQLAPYFDLPGCEFVSLQYGEPQEEVAAVNGAFGNRVRIFPKAEIDDFEALAALVANLDVVVSVQTALVHLCGAIGKDCLTLVPHNPEWRYTLDAPTMPWYGSVRLFRQPSAGAWDPVVARVKDVLLERLGADAA